MRAVQFERAGGKVQLADVAAPVAPPGGVVVSVHATGLCRSDWHGWAGHETLAFPHVPGHEFAGVVHELGSGVQHWSIGDRVTSPFVTGCGLCEWCVRGAAQVCPVQEQPGFTHWGSFAELVVVHSADTNLVAIPTEVSDVAAAALGCRFATAYRALAARANVQQGEWVVVVGAGGVGLSAIAIAHALGARSIAIDPNPDARATALEFGAAHALDSSENVAEIIQELCGGAHVAIDAVGSELAATIGLLSLRRQGRHVQVGLLPATLGHPALPMDRVIAWELAVLGSHGMAAADYPPMLELVANGGIDLHRLVQRVAPLSDATHLLPEMSKSRQAGITVFDPRL